MSSRQSIREILVKRSARFSFSVVCAVLTLFVILQSIILISEHDSTKQLIVSWLGKNQQRIEQALFLQNALAVGGVLDELGTTKDQVRSIRVALMDGSKAGAYGDLRDKSCFSSLPSTFEGFQAQPLKGRLCYRGALHFAERQYGWVEIVADYNLTSLFVNTLLCLMLSALLLLVVRGAASLLVRELKRSLMDPLSHFAETMDAQHSELSQLSPMRRNSKEFANAPREVLDLIDSYNGLITTIRELSSKEIQRIELLSYSKVAKQVSHDIRSPLTALKMASHDLDGVDEDPPLHA